MCSAVDLHSRESGTPRPLVPQLLGLTIVVSQELLDGRAQELLLGQPELLAVLFLSNY